MTVDAIRQHSDGDAPDPAPDVVDTMRQQRRGHGRQVITTALR